MAKVQSRRTISINRSLFELVHREAARNGESAAQFVSEAIRARLTKLGRKRLPDQHYDGPSVLGRVFRTAGMRAGGGR